MEMKAITLTQPWASLVALGEKRVETRSWQTVYRGPLAIHAAKGFPGWAKRQCWIPPFREVLVGHGLSPDSLPLGRVLCVVMLERCWRTEDVGSDSLQGFEAKFGDYTAGRFAWMLGPVLQLFDPGFYARGSLGLWNWEGAK
jgi:activating signal cointegrator 1